jgi:NAD(P)-dependent dehydrogenase (short-subunit alcohol dehydrogenase family)
MSGERLAGKVAIITGAAAGIGAAACAQFCGEGARVVAADVKEPSEGLMATFDAYPDAIRFEHMDVTNEEEWSRLIETCGEQFGIATVLFNNAGVHGRKKAVHEETLEGFYETLNVNLVGVFLGMRATIPGMLEAGVGSIINTSSVWGQYAAAGNAAYHASKGAVTVLSKNAALTYAKEGIRVNALLPGYTDTPMVKNVTEEEARALIAMTPIGRIGRPEEVASIVVYLASDESSFTTGGVFFVDGGMAAL